MIDDDRNNLIVEAAHRRMDSIEGTLNRLTNNPAPTVPQYDLSFVSSNCFLAIWGDRYNGLPGLYNVFSDQSQSDVWLRLTWLNSFFGGFHNSIYVAGFVFSEWFNDTYYSGGPPYSGIGYQAIGIAVNFANGAGLGWSATLINDFGASNSGSSLGGNSQGTDPIVDLHVTRTGLNSNRGGTWASEVWVDGVLRWTGTHNSFGDIGHNLGRLGIGGLLFYTQYGNYVSPRYLPIDDVMVGTSQGANDLMDTADFTGGSYGPLNDSLDYAPNPSFEILCETISASFTYAIGTNGHVDFTDTSISIPSIQSWAWDFGDGLGTDTVQNPSYQYGPAGFIGNVMLTITNRAGKTSTVTVPITVSGYSTGMVACYTAKGQSNTTSSLYSVNPSTLAATSIGPIGFGITGLAIDPTTGTLWGITNNNSSSHPHSIITINPSTGAGTFVANIRPIANDDATHANVSDITFDSSGQMYGISTWDGGLVTINKSTGAAVNINSGGPWAGGLDFDGSTLWQVDGNGNIETLDSSTGADTYITSMPGSFSVVNAMKIAPSGKMIITALESGLTKVFIADPATDFSTDPCTLLPLGYLDDGDGFDAICVVP